MLEFTLKFLSGDSRKYEVDESTTVLQFKERLRDELNIQIERQRLIFQGKVLQDNTKLADSNIQNKTIHFVERAEPIPPPAPNNASGGASNASGSGSVNDALNQAMMDEVNETTSIFINAFPGAVNLQPNDIQSLVQNLLNDLGDVGRQAQVNTTVASDGQGVDVNIDFGNINQILEQQEINERFRSIGRMLTRLRLRIDRIEQIVQSNFRPAPSPPPQQQNSERTASPARPAAAAAPSTSSSTERRTPPPPASSSSSATTFLGMEDITSTEMDAESQGSVLNTSDTMHTPPSTTSTTPVENASTPTTNNNPVITAPRTARDLAELMNTIETEQNRLQAHYQVYLRTITQSESFNDELNSRQRFYSLYNEATHLIAHIYHNVTDFTLDLNDPLETRLLHLGESPISQAGLASIAQANAAGLGAGQESGTRVIPRTSRSLGRRPQAVATARIMGPIQISASTNPVIMSGEARMPFQNPMAGIPRMMFNPTPRAPLSARPQATLTPNTVGAQQSMRFNLGTLPYTFMQMGPDGITVNQVSASVVADVQTSNSSPSSSSSPQQQQQPNNTNNTNRPMPTNISPGATHVISSGPIQINGDQLDSNLAAQIAQTVTNSVQQHIAQIVNQQTSGTGINNNQSLNNNINAPDGILRSTFVLQPDSQSTTTTRATDALRSRSADSRPTNPNANASNTDDDDADWIDLPPMDIQMPPPPPPPQLPNPTAIPIPRIRGPAIIQSVDRSLPCASPYFTQTLRPPYDNPNNTSNLTPTEAAALNNTGGRAVIVAAGPQRPRGRHRHPAGPWAQQNQQQQQLSNLLLSSASSPAGATVLTPSGHAYNMTAHSFEIPMVISTTTTAELPQQTSNNNSQQQSSSNDGQQAQMNTIISQVLSQIIPGVLRSGNGRVRLNIGQNNPGSNNNSNSSTTQTTSSTSSSATATPLQSTGIPPAVNIPGVVAGNLDFSNIARSLNSMVQGITGRLLPGATLINPNPTATLSSNTTFSTQNSNTSTSTTSSSSTTTTNNDENDAITEQMLQELLRLLGGGIDNPELDNLTIGSFMQRFGEDVESRTNDGTNLISELFSAMTSRMRFTDVWNLVLGNAIGSRINEARQSATEYLQNTVLQGRPVTPETLNEIADKLYESLLQEASVNFNDLRVKPNVNISNVMKRFFQIHARKLLHILFDDANNVWFDRFRQQLITMRNEFLALLSQCLEGGQAAAIDFILNRHRIIFRSTNPMIVTWSETYLRTSLTNAFTTIHSSPPNVSSYLVEPPPPPVPVVERTVQAPTPSRSSNSIVNRTDQERQTTTTTAQNSSWQTNLPNDWIPIVVRDVNTQLDAPPQAPFSDAYKEGMPAKRRRVHMREDLTSSNLLQTLVLRAASDNQTLNAPTPESVLTGEAASTTLVDTFEQELKRLIQERLRQDRDYSEVQSRMPNTKRYLDGDK